MPKIPISYSLQFRGQAEQKGDGTFLAKTCAPSCVLRTTLDDQGVHGSYEATGDDQAICRSRVILSGDRAFDETGSISFGNGNALYFHTISPGTLAPSPDPQLRHGSCIRDVVGGQGQFERAEGRITSNFLFSDTGEITDEQVGLIFVPQPTIDPDATGGQS